MKNLFILIFAVSFHSANAQISKPKCDSYIKYGDNTNNLVPGGMTLISQIVVNGNQITTTEPNQPVVLIGNQVQLSNLSMNLGTRGYFSAMAVPDCETNNSSERKGSNGSGSKGGKTRGIKFFNLSAIKLYPNPAKDQINVSFTAPEDETVSFTMLNVLGQAMGETVSGNFSAGNALQTMSTQGLPPGFYFIEVKTPGGQHKFKFVKE
jgi:hypothetical protein